MVVKNLKTEVLKTATVTSVKLATPADRIGQGLVASTAYSTDNLSRGEKPFPLHPEAEAVRSRQLSAMQSHQSMDGDTMTPTSSAGCPSDPGAMAGRFVWLVGASPITGWQPATRAAAERFADSSCTSFPGDLRHNDRLGSDCQSPDRLAGNRIANRERGSAAAARK